MATSKSPQHCQRIALALRGKSKSPEHRQRMSATHIYRGQRTREIMEVLPQLKWHTAARLVRLWPTFPQVTPEVAEVLKSLGVDSDHQI